MMFMKKIGLCLLFIGWHSVYAQQAKTCFTQMPDSLCPLLTAVNRADFVDFLESKMKAEVSNRLGGKSEMTRLTGDFIEIRTSAQSTWQMKLLPLNDSTRVICTVSTVSAPVADSHLKFYTTAWKELPAEGFLPQQAVTLDDFFPAPADTVDIYDYQAARRQADILFLKASLDEKEPTLTFTLTTPDYIDREMAEKLKPSMRPSLTYRWRGGRFVSSDKQ